MKKLIFIFILAIIFTSCSSDNNNNSETNDDEVEAIVTPSLIGKWNLVKWCGGIAGDCWYPPEDYQEMVEFKDNLTYIETINNVTEVESTYLVTDTIFVANSAYFIIEFGFGNHTEFSFINDTLSLGGNIRKNFIRIND